MAVKHGHSGRERSERSAPPGMTIVTDPSPNRERDALEQPVSNHAQHRNPTPATAFAEARKQRILVLDGAMGTMIQALKLDEEALPRRALRRLEPRGARQQRPARSSRRPDAIRDIHLAYFRAGADIVSTNTFSSTSIAQADYGLEDIAYELNRAGATLAREAAAASGARGRPAALRRRRHRADQPHRLDFARRVESRLPRHHLRPAARGLRRAGARPDRRRRRHAADRDDLRHAQRQGGDLRHQRALRGARPRRAGDDLRHHHRPLRPPAVRADAGGVLEFGAARRAGHRRPQLRARRQGDARAHRRDRPHRRHARLRLSQCRPAQRVRPLRRKPGIHGGAARRIRRERARQHRRRLLRHDAGAHRAPSPKRSRARRRVPCRKCRAACACRAWSRSCSRRKSPSSMSASAPTSPARRNSAS